MTTCTDANCNCCSMRWPTGGEPAIQCQAEGVLAGIKGLRLSLQLRREAAIGRPGNLYDDIGAALANLRDAANTIEDALRLADVPMETGEPSDLLWRVVKSDARAQAGEPVTGEPEPERDRLAGLVEDFLERRSWSPEARIALCLAARTVRRGRHLSNVEQLNNLAAALDEPDEPEPPLDQMRLKGAL